MEDFNLDSFDFFVLETSSNLNENPKIEQFAFEEDKGLFDWYLEFFESLKKVSRVL